MQLSFRGTTFHGWQSQPNATSVQKQIEQALQTLLHENTVITGAGRTDTGVHARFFVAHFDTDNSLPANAKDFMYKMNALLPGEIAIQDIYPVKPDAHARYSAISRTYKYNINRLKDPLVTEYSWYYALPLDVASMNQAALRLLEYTDFTSFSKLHTDVSNNMCTISEAEWTQEGSQLTFTITANRFLRNMVRAIVGTLIEIGRGKITIEGFCSIIEGRNRNLAGFSVPAKGLMLYNIRYDENTIKL